jgi:hypothetical protein
MGVVVDSSASLDGHATTPGAPRPTGGAHR